MPNKIQYFSKGYVFLFLVKTHMPIFPYSFGKMNFVWRQLRLAFFGATASAVALFDFIERILYQMIIFVAILYLSAFGALIYFNYKIARKFERIAFYKDPGRALHTFAMCFWLGLPGYLYVIAMPNTQFNTELLNQQKQIVKLLKNVDKKIPEDAQELSSNG